jgi:hypothetical protein
MGKRCAGACELSEHEAVKGIGLTGQIGMITRRAYGFHSPTALIALAMLSLAGLCPPLPR